MNPTSGLDLLKIVSRWGWGGEVGSLPLELQPGARSDWDEQRVEGALPSPTRWSLIPARSRAHPQPPPRTDHGSPGRIQGR